VVSSRARVSFLGVRNGGRFGGVAAPIQQEAGE
jgi:hypothetical protein